MKHTLGGYVNKENCRIWASEKSQVIEELQLDPEKVTVWCALWSEGVIRPYDGTTVTINSKRYGRMSYVMIFFCLLLKNTIWRISGFSKAVPHNSSEYSFIARDISCRGVISRRGDINWPP